MRRSHESLIGIVEVAGDDPRAEAQTARRFDEQHGEIPAGAPAAIQSLVRRLRAFILAALIADPSGHAEAEILEQGERVRRDRRRRTPAPILPVVRPGPHIAGPSVRRGRSIRRPNSGRDRRSPRRRCRRPAMPTIEFELHDAVDDEAVGLRLETQRSRRHCRRHPAPRSTCAAGATVTSLEINRKSRLSRGRSINRCGPRLTGRR